MCDWRLGLGYAQEEEDADEEQNVLLTMSNGLSLQKIRAATVLLKGGSIHQGVKIHSANNCQY